MPNRIIDTEHDPKKKPEERKVVFELEVEVPQIRTYTFTRQQLEDRKRVLTTRKQKAGERLMDISQELEDVYSMLRLMDEQSASADASAGGAS